MGGEFRGEWIHVYVWLSGFAVHRKLSQLYNGLYPNIKYKVKKNLGILMQREVNGRPR